jgi:hypothetical protein
MSRGSFFEAANKVLLINLDQTEQLLAEAHGREQRMEEALRTILNNTEEGAIKHRDYDHLAKDIADAARAALEGR